MYSNFARSFALFCHKASGNGMRRRNVSKLTSDEINVKERRSGGLQRLVCPSIHEAPHARQNVNSVAWAYNPANAPAREPPVLGQAVDDNDRVLVDVVHKLCRRKGIKSPRFDARSPLVAVLVVTVMRVKLVHQHQAVLVPRDGAVLAQLLASNNRPGWITRIREEKAAQPVKADLPPQGFCASGCAVLLVLLDYDWRNAVELCRAVRA